MKNIIELGNKRTAKKYWLDHISNVEVVELSLILASGIKLTEILQPQDNKTFSITYKTNSVVYECPFVLGKKSCQGCEYLNEHIVKEYKNGNVKTAMVCDRKADCCSAAEVFNMIWNSKEKIKSGKIGLVVKEKEAKNL